VFDHQRLRGPSSSTGLRAEAQGDHLAPVSLVGRRTLAAAQAARELLERNRVSHRSIDLDDDPVGRLLGDGPIAERPLPVALFANGETRDGPPTYVEPYPGQVRASAVKDYMASASWLSELARRAGLHCQPEREDWWAAAAEMTG
jgi:hypothetical protein